MAHTLSPDWTPVLLHLPPSSSLVFSRRRRPRRLLRRRPRRLSPQVVPWVVSSLPPWLLRFLLPGACCLRLCLSLLSCSASPQTPHPRARSPFSSRVLSARRLPMCNRLKTVLSS